jgi:DNA-binding response OmpR family regulator
MRILVAEDDPTARHALNGLLRALGHDVIAVADGEEALEHCSLDPVPVVITNWQMPHIDGLELCRRIRAARRRRYTYIIVVTAYEGRENFLTGMEAGADDFVTKPLDAAMLAARLRVAERVISLQAEVSHLKGLLPICMYCHKIRDGQDSWHPIDQYLAERTNSHLSHGICPDCFDVQVQEHAWERPPAQR